MDSVRLDEDRPERTGRARVLARSAPNAEVRTDFRNHQFVLERDHADGLGGTVLRAGPAVRPFGIDDAVVLDELRDPELRQLFLLLLHRQDRSARTDLKAQGAVVIAVCNVVGHARLENAADAILEK